MYLSNQGSPFSYVHWTAGGDSCAGRFLAALSVLKGDFGTVGTHFHPFNANMSDEAWAEIVPSYYDYPEVFRRTSVPVLVAVAVYHIVNGDVAKLFPANHPYLRSAFFTQRSKWEPLIPLLAPPAMHTCPGCDIVVTGTTALSVCLSKISEVRTLLKVQHADVRSLLEVLKERVETIAKESPGRVAAQVTSELRENFTIEGAVQWGQPVQWEHLGQRGQRAQRGQR